MMRIKSHSGPPTGGVLLALAAGAFAVLPTSGCQSEPEALDLTSLRRSGEVTFICVDENGDGAPLVDCPQGERTDDRGFSVGKPGYELHALVTQTLSAEVAVVRTTGTESATTGTRTSAAVLDVDPSVPGVTPLRIGAQPVDIVSTPGGRASFVSVGEVGREGVFALPTSCIFEPSEEARRDFTSWPACSLGSRPGHMQVVVGGEGSEFCSDAPAEESQESVSSCRVDLATEDLKPGRRKLLVSLPEEGKLVVLDAQELLDRQPGTYQPCHIDAEYVFDATVPASIVQPLPDDLSGDGAEPVRVYSELGGTYESRPAGMALADARLYVADQGGPLIHRLDVGDPCNIQTLPPLISTSYLQPERVVTTSKVAISPLSAAGARFAYAVDEVGNELASVIPFDVSPGASSRTPLVRPGSIYMPLEAPDRIEFSSAVKDVAFATLERPVADIATGSAVSGTLCDPDPAISETSVEAAYRPTSNTAGAGPLVLRGLFGYALLASGQLVLVDVEDYDAACRRPKTVNGSSELDFRGCRDDSYSALFLTRDRAEDGVPTVTNEATCRAVVPHRARSRSRIVTEEGGGAGAPSLRSFGRLSRYGRGISVNRFTAEGKRSPILLGVNFQDPSKSSGHPAEVHVGSVLYQRDSDADALIVDPNVAERTAPVLPFVEPRAYPPSERLSVVYEGALTAERRTGELTLDEEQELRFTDSSTEFCEAGVQGEVLTESVGRAQFGLQGGALTRFVRRHTDYVQLTNLLYDETDSYWEGAGARCGDSDGEATGSGFAVCDSLFGRGEEENLNSSRDLKVVASYQDSLELAPRFVAGAEAEALVRAMACCFPGAAQYRIRAGHQWVVSGDNTGYRHSVGEDATSEDGKCIFDTAPRKSLFRGRAFEVSNVACDNTDPEDAESCGVGLRTDEDVVCGYDATRGPVEIGGSASECIFDGLTRRFVIYRGLEPTERDMVFTYDIIGGFQGLTVPLGTNGIALPVSMVPLPEFGAMGVVDSQNQGLVIVDLANSGVGRRFF